MIGGMAFGLVCAYRLYLGGGQAARKTPLYLILLLVAIILVSDMFLLLYRLKCLANKVGKT